MESKEGLQTDTDCCQMKTEGGECPKPLEEASAFLSKKWTISIIITIGNFETVRFNELQKRLNGPTAKTVSERLKELGEEGIVKKERYAEVPPRVEYSLTDEGEDLLDALHPLIHWAERR